MTKQTLDNVREQAPSHRWLWDRHSPKSSGCLNVAPRAIERLVYRVVVSTPGVAGVAARHLRRGTPVILDEADASTGIQVVVQGHSLQLGIYIVTTYGSSITSIAREVISNTVQSLNKVLGIDEEHPIRITVTVQGLAI